MLQVDAHQMNVPSSKRIRVVSAATDIAPWEDSILLVDGTYTITLPDPGRCPGHTITISPADASTTWSGTVTIACESSCLAWVNNTLNACTDVVSYASDGVRWVSPVAVSIG